MSIHQQEPCVQLTFMPQLAEALSLEDDWTGTTDAASRRRAQTRLNMRAYRKRKAQEKKAMASKAEAETIKSEPVVECWDINQESMSIVPASHAMQIYDARQPLLAYRTKKNQSNVTFPLSPDHLITLLQYNALRALAVNRTFISGMLSTAP
ncbi:hypothetical protein RAB80_011276 [Fusarium oxysporum f. sp. vasinfectum]|nr:hypothetical protein RAB80_011276 [Fusarium oxysporum f. sp. vasinfectum]